MSIYAALKRMSTDGAVQICHSEKVGNRPERTVYEITEHGRQELGALRDAVLSSTELRPDPVDLALQSAHGMSPIDLRRVFESRTAAIAAESIAWQNQWDIARPHITARESLTFEHTALRLQAEVAWCQTVLDHLHAEIDDDPIPHATAKDQHS